MNEREKIERVSTIQTCFVKSPELGLDSFNDYDSIQKVWTAFDNNNKNTFSEDNIAWD